MFFINYFQAARFAQEHQALIHHYFFEPASYAFLVTVDKAINGLIKIKKAIQDFPEWLFNFVTQISTKRWARPKFYSQARANSEAHAPAQVLPVADQFF